LLALAGHTDLDASQEPTCMHACAVVPNHQPDDLKGNPDVLARLVLL
jgi:hypothetical protein